MGDNEGLMSLVTADTSGPRHAIHAILSAGKRKRTARAPMKNTTRRLSSKNFLRELRSHLDKTMRFCFVSFVFYVEHTADEEKQRRLGTKPSAYL